MREEKCNVKEFYEKYGWKVSDKGLYNDTVDFVDTRPILKTYQDISMTRIAQAFRPSGNLFMDAGCGALPSEQYVDLSKEYRYRICVDISLAALTEARNKLNSKALCVQADITCLPFKPKAFDAVLCAHVLYHIPPDEQGAAIHEIDAALAPGGRAVIVYTWPDCLMNQLAVALNPRLVLPRIPGARYLWRTFFRPSSMDAAVKPHRTDSGPSLYFRPQTRRNLKQSFKGLHWKMACWQSIGLPFSEAFITNGRIGRFITKTIVFLENLFPYIMARIGCYPLFILKR